MDFITRFEYDSDYLPPPRVVSEKTENGLLSRLLVMTMPDGCLRAAEMIRPTGKGPYAAALFVHWYEPKACDSNRSQFRDEARLLAQQGVVCLLVETMWSDPDWFFKRTQNEDEENTLNQVIELSVFSDLLLTQPEVDSKRFAYIGPDFGAMYGVLFGAVDTRPDSYVLMAGTSSFADWYLYYPHLNDQERDLYLSRMRDYDPIHHIADLAPANLFMQFATHDEHVPEDKARTIFETALEPKQIVWYECGHGLNEQARIERLSWLSVQLKLGEH
jgi:dienelactone hydrolase